MALIDLNNIEHQPSTIQLVTYKYRIVIGFHRVIEEKRNVIEDIGICIIEQGTHSANDENSQII